MTGPTLAELIAETNERHDELPDAPSRCEWFALCPNLATGTTPHPTLGDVPSCDRCHRFATS